MQLGAPAATRIVEGDEPDKSLAFMLQHDETKGPCNQECEETTVSYASIMSLGKMEGDTCTKTFTFLVRDMRQMAIVTPRAMAWTPLPYTPPVYNMEGYAVKAGSYWTSVTGTVGDVLNSVLMAKAFPCF